MSDASTLPSGAVRPSNTNKPSPWPWPDADVSAAAFRFAAHGGTEAALVVLLDRLAYQGVRRLLPYLARIDGDELAEILARANAFADARDVARAEADPRALQRGDLMRLRTKVRWPWRTSSGQGAGRC